MGKYARLASDMLSSGSEVGITFAETRLVPPCICVPDPSDQQLEIFYVARSISNSVCRHAAANLLALRSAQVTCCCNSNLPSTAPVGALV